MDARSDIRLGWSRMVGLLASFVTGIFLVVGLAFGGFRLFAGDPLCFSLGDIGDPDCREAGGLGDVRLSTWLIAAAACVSLVAAVVTSWRMRRPAQLLLVLCLCVGVIAAAVGLVATV